MSYLSMTRLKLKSPRHLIPFWIYNEKVVWQVRKAEGFLRGRWLANYSLSMWTTTLWESQQVAKKFYLQGSHREAMTRLSKWSSEAVLCSQDINTTELPSWQKVGDELAHQGRFVAIEEPSFNHQNKVVEAPNFVSLTREFTATHSQYFVLINK